MAIDILTVQDIKILTKSSIQFDSSFLFCLVLILNSALKSMSLRSALIQPLITTLVKFLNDTLIRLVKKIRCFYLQNRRSFESESDKEFLFLFYNQFLRDRWSLSNHSMVPSSKYGSTLFSLIASYSLETCRNR